MEPIDFAIAKPTDESMIPVIDVSGVVSGDDIKGVAEKSIKQLKIMDFFIFQVMELTKSFWIRRFQWQRIF